MRKNRPIVMLANGHSPFDTRIFVKQARSLTQAGYLVSIIVPHASHEIREGIVIIASPQRKSGFGKLFINPISIFRRAISQPTDAIFCVHDSDILITGLLLKLFRRTVIYDAHEDTPLQISYQHWIPKFLRKPYAALYYLIEKASGHLFDAIIVAEPVIAKYFPSSKTHLVRNFPFAKDFESIPVKPFDQRRNAIAYVGTLSRVRGLFQMLDAAKMASEKCSFEFVLGGNFAPGTLEQEVLTNYEVTYLKWVNYNDLVALLADCKLGMILPNPVERYKTNYPVKMFEYMAAGVPVLGSREGESAQFVREATCGVLVNPLDTQEIANAIVDLLGNPSQAEQMGMNGRKAVMEKLNWENESQVLLALYQKLE